MSGGEGRGFPKRGGKRTETCRESLLSVGEKIQGGESLGATCNKIKTSWI
jgi:hypothetical protein